MRVIVRLLLTVGCVGVVAYSSPAFAKLQPKAVAAQKPIETKRVDKRALPQRLAAQKSVAKQDPLAHARAMHAARLRVQDHTSLRPVVPISQFSARPNFGWPTLVTEARKYLGTNPTAMDRRWCARFMNLVLNKAGYSGTGSDAARSFVGYGRRVSEPRIGAIAVLSRGKNRNLGHVGIVTGIDPRGNPIIISGNHGRRVGEGAYSRTRVLAFVMPAEQPQLARTNSGALSDAEREGIASPIVELLAAINNEAPREQRRAGPPPQVQPAPQRLLVQPVPQAPVVRTRLVEQVASAQARPVGPVAYAMQPQRSPQARRVTKPIAQ